jgi:hypothetical protein
MSDLHHCHPLDHQGVSSIGRLVQALHPDSFRLDERTTQDLIVEAHRFAQTLRFFDETNTQPEGGYWESFWEVEILTYLAVLAATDTDEIQRQFKALNEQFEQAKTAKPAPGSSKKTQSAGAGPYKPLLEFLRLLALSLEDSYNKLVRIKHPLQTLLLSRIRKDNCCDQEELEGALIRLIGFHKGADPGLELSRYTGFLASDKRWGLENRIGYDAISANPHFSQDDLRELFNSFYNTWLVLKNAAQSGFDAELARMELPEEEEYRIVQPHIVLFLVFLRLFRYAQESLNELGSKHLAFYYEEVLGLRRRGEVPDEVFLLFELAKDFDQYFLEKGTGFLAGKDKNGQPLLFETTEDWVLRPAQVADIKNTWIDLNCGGMHGNPDVKKAYFNGAEKPNESAGAWRMMGDDRDLPNGEIGFAIASPQLILREGKRVMIITLNLKSQIGSADLEKLNQKDQNKIPYFQVFLSSEEKWIVPEYNEAIDPADNLDVSNLPNLEKASFGIKFHPDAIHLGIILERDDPPVDHLGKELASKEVFDTTWPVIKVLLNPALKKPWPEDQYLITTSIYEILRTLVIGEIVIKVDVRGIREKLIIQTDQGVFNGTEKVYPFGPTPEIGQFFYIGSTEVFQKALTGLKVNIQWIGPPEDFGKHYKYYDYDYDALRTLARVVVADPNGEIHPNPKVQIDFIDKADATTPEPVEKVEYENDDIDDVATKTMKVSGEVLELDGSAGTGDLKVKYGNGYEKSFRIEADSNKYSIDISPVPFDSKIELSKADRKYAFSIGNTNHVKGYLLPKATDNQASIKRIYNSTELEIEVKGEDNQPVSELEIALKKGISSDEIKLNEEGRYLVSAISLKDHDLIIKSANYEKTILDHNDYNEDEFKQFSEINITLYKDAPSDVPGPTEIADKKIISGRIVDRDGEPIRGAKVTAKKASIEKSALTNEKGDFSFEALTESSSDWTLQAFFDGTRSSLFRGAKTGSNYTIQVSDEIKVSDPFKGILKGTVKSLDNEESVWGVKFYDQNSLLLGETNENGAFEIRNVDLGIQWLKVAHEAFNSINDIPVKDNAEYELIIVPKATYHVFSGKVVSFFNPEKGLENVEVQVKGTGVKVKSNNQGEFLIPVPTDLQPVLTFSKSGFKTVDIYLNKPENPISYIKLTLPEANPVDLLVLEPSGKGKTIIRNNFEVAVNPPYGKRDPRTQDFSRYSPTLKRGFLRFKLVGDDFLHEKYPKILVYHSLNFPSNVPPNPPYTPSTNFISLDYTSTQIISGEENKIPGENGRGIDQFYHLLPFNGHKWISLEAPPKETDPNIQLIYPYMPDDTLPVTYNGETQPYAPANLFIGISELEPGGTLSLLFQIAGGTEKDPEALTPAIHWSYLATGNNWQPFETGQILKDTTHMLTRTGMIQFAVPTTAVKGSTMLNPDYYWLRAAAKQADLGKSPTKVQALPSIKDIRAQVVQARFKNAGNEFSHLGSPLPAGTISKLVESRTAVKKVEQPLESSGGRQPESMGLDFYYRVSERLRHKDRAVTVWDYEHLLLERYPEVAAAKCIQHTRYKPADAASELAPGYLTVAVIPDLKKRKGEPWPEPRFTRGDLDEMRLFLAAHTNLFMAYGEKEEAHLQLENPLYEKVDILVAVAFMPGVDEAFFKKQLKNELANYISPWLADPSKPPAFGRTLERSAILQFIEERPYVDYVDVSADKFLVRMQVVDISGRPVLIEGKPPSNQSIKVSTVKTRTITGRICPGTARSILVSGEILVGSTLDEKPVNLSPMPSKVEILDQTETTGDTTVATAANGAASPTRTSGVKSEEKTTARAKPEKPTPAKGSQIAKSTLKTKGNTKK